MARITEVETSFRIRLAEMNKEKRTAYRMLLTSLDAGDLSDEEYTAMRTRLETAYGSHAAVGADHWRALRGTLTETQWRKLPEAAPKALALGTYSVAKRGGFYMGPGKPGSTPGKK